MQEGRRVNMCRRQERVNESVGCWADVCAPFDPRFLESRAEAHVAPAADFAEVGVRVNPPHFGTGRRVKVVQMTS